MGVQKIIVVIEKREVQIDFNTAGKLSDLRRALINQKYISNDDENKGWRFVDVSGGKKNKAVDESLEKFIPVSEFIDDTNKVHVANIKHPQQVDLRLFVGSVPRDIKFDVTLDLLELRNFLIKQKFIPDDNDDYAWRFLSPVEHGDISESIMPLESEKELLVEKFLYGSNKIRMVNRKGDKIHADLVGTETEYLLGGELRVRVERLDSITPGKFAPVMLKHVKTVRNDINADFAYVVLCEKGTALNFQVEIVNHGGLVYSIVPDEGDAICTGIAAPNNFAGISYYESSKRPIIIDSTKNLNIPTKQAIGYRRVTVKAWKYIAFIRNGKRYEVDSDLKPSSAPMQSDGVIGVDGKTIETGGLKPGEGKVTTPLYPGADSVITDSKQVLGTVDIDLFVFKTREDAENLIESRISLNYE